MGAVRDNNFFVVHGWMINQLGLKGTELELYAIIYGFSQAEGQQFHGGLQYLADWTNVAKRNVLARLQSLVEKGLLVKTDAYVNGVKTCEYRCVLNLPGGDETSPAVMKHHRGGDETSPGVVMKHHRGGDETSPNNIEDNIPDNIPDKKECGGQAPTAPEKAKRFIPPTVEEVAAYCRERGNHVDAQRFVDYYTANGWMRGKTKIKDWRACVRTWERGSGVVGGGFQRPQQERSRIKTEADYAAGMEGWGAV